jgi:ATP-dependent Clp protease ATP-binding subunit ClpB
MNLRYKHSLGGTASVSFSSDAARFKTRAFSSMPPGSQGQGPWVNPDNQVAGQHLKDYGVDLTALAKDNKLDPIIGRHNEIRRTLQILARRTKNNPVLVRAHN